MHILFWCFKRTVCKQSFVDSNQKRQPTKKTPTIFYLHLHPECARSVILPLFLSNEVSVLLVIFRGDRFVGRSRKFREMGNHWAHRQPVDRSNYCCRSLKWDYSNTINNNSKTHTVHKQNRYQIDDEKTMTTTMKNTRPNGQKKLMIIIIMTSIVS